MASLPRIITVDPTGTVARIVRATIDLSEYAVRQIDVPSGDEALDEIKLGGCRVVVSAFHLQDMKAFEFALKVKQANSDVAVIVLANETDPEMDEETQAESPYVYMQRPLNIDQFSRVLFAGMRGEDIFAAVKAKGGGGGAPMELGPVPSLDVDRASEIIDGLLVDLGAMAIILISRQGEVLVERGAPGYLDREQLTGALLPTVMTTIEMRDLVGGNTSSLQFYDGDVYDVYVLSVGMHHLLVISFDGELGQRQFGLVNRYGRRAVEELIVLLGAYAFVVQRVEAPEEEEPLQRVRTAPTPEPEPEAAPLERAEIFSNPTPPKKQQMDAIPDDEFDIAFLDQLGAVNSGDADDLFSLENLENLTSSANPEGTLGVDEATGIGIIPTLGDE